VPGRYTAVWVSPVLVHVLDAKFGNAPAAFVHLRRTVDGDGWTLAPRSVSRMRSRKLHATPEDAIASMKYMTRATAREALAPAADIARMHGARIEQSGDGLWAVLDQHGTPLWFAVFRTEDYAARAYCLVHGVPMDRLPDRPAPAA